MFLTKSLDYAFSKLKVEPHTKECVASSLKYIQLSIRALGYNQVEAHRIKRKHIRFIMDHCEQERNLSARSWNAYRTYLAMLFEQLLDYELVEENPVLQLRKKQEDEVVRTILTLEQRKLLIEHLKETDPVFLRFIQIFFHSGARRTELLSLRIENTYLDKGYYQVFVKKGRKKRWVTKVIKEIALPFWREQIGNHISGYIFSIGLLPGDKPIRPEQVTRRWKRHVKDKLDITADLYSLKHLNTDEVSSELSLMEAAKHNSHSVQMAKKHYAVNETLRELERVRKIKNEL
jgi:integrase